MGTYNLSPQWLGLEWRLLEFETTGNEPGNRAEAGFQVYDLDGVHRAMLPLNYDLSALPSPGWETRSFRCDLLRCDPDSCCLRTKGNYGFFVRGSLSGSQRAGSPQAGLIKGSISEIKVLISNTPAHSPQFFLTHFRGIMLIFGIILEHLIPHPQI